MNKLGIKIGKRLLYVEVNNFSTQDSRIEFVLDGQEISVIIPGQYRDEDILDWIIINNQPYELSLGPDFQTINIHHRVFPVEIRDLAVSLTRPRIVDGRVKAPIPGMIRQLFISPGMQVEVGQSLLVLEAMKMENEILAPKAGTIRSVNVVNGQNINLNDILVEIE